MSQEQVETEFQFLIPFRPTGLKNKDGCLS